MEMKTFIRVIFLLSYTSFFCGCALLLPSVSETTKSEWNSYDDAKNSFDKIILNQTTPSQLKSLGFDPNRSPNIKILTYLDVKKQFIVNPTDKSEHLPPGVRDCIDAGDGCHGIEVNIVKSYSKRYGNLLLDIFNFRRQTQQNGWEFNGLIVMKNGTVVYKLSGGKPNIEADKDQKNPLGPLQSIDGILFLKNSQ